MEDLIKDNGKMIIFMVMEYILCQMVENIKVINK